MSSSRRREQGLGVSFAALKDIHSPCIRGVVALGIILMAILFVWLGAAMEVYRLSFGDWVPPSFADFAHEVFTTPAGWTLIVVGCSVGLLLGMVAFTISVVSVPLLLDRDVDVATAVETSIRVVLANPQTMALWGLIVAGALMIGSLPFLVGLSVVFPVLGHRRGICIARLLSRDARCGDDKTRLTAFLPRPGASSGRDGIRWLSRWF